MKEVAHMNKVIMSLSIPLLAILCYADLDAEFSKRARIRGPEKTTLKITGQDGTEYYIDAVSGPEEYITLEDYGAALEADRKNDEASKRKKEEKVRLERERLISDQPTLRECAKSLLSQLFFDVNKLLYIDRKLAKDANGINLSVAHFAYPTLRQSCKESQWLDALNAAYDIVANSAELTRHYDIFPPKQEIEDVYSRLIAHRFKVKWTLPDNLDIVAWGDNPIEIMSSLDGNILDDEKRPRVYQALAGRQMCSDIPIFSNKKIFLGFKKGKPYGKGMNYGDDNMYFEDEFDDNDYVIPGYGSIMRERIEISTKFREREITKDECQKRKAQSYKRFENAMSEVFVALHDAKAADNVRKRMDVVDQKEGVPGSGDCLNVSTQPTNLKHGTSNIKDRESDADIQNKVAAAQQDKQQFKKVWSTVEPENPNATKVEQNLSRLKCGMENEALAKIYDKYSEDKCKDVLNHLVSEMKSACSLKTADERMAARKNLLDKYKGIFLTGLGQRMDKIIGVDTPQGKSTAPMNGGNGVAAGASSAYQKCVDCDGAKYIKEEAECNQCNGQGQIEKVKLGLNGTSRRVISKCANCNGTGVATKKTPCATCKGKGKIRVK